MKPYNYYYYYYCHFIIFLIIFPFSTPVTTTSHRRRILHQPLFPATTPQQPPPSPPPSTTTDHPFFQQTPDGQQTPSLPPPSPTSAAATVPIPPQPAAAKPAKKIAVVISVGIVTLGMLSALAFFVYKHKSKAKLLDSNKSLNNSFSDQNSSVNLAASSFLYIGTVEPSSESINTMSLTSHNGSPYNKLNSVKRSDRYRPSPELQPLPPLTKPPPPATFSSSDDDYEDEYEGSYNNFYTPNGSTDDGFSLKSFSLKRNLYSKRTSPKSRLSVSSSPEIASSPGTTSGPRRTKFAGPPPGPDMTRLHNEKGKIPVPPPPPAGRRKDKQLGKMSTPPVAKVIPKMVKTMSFKNEEVDGDGSRPKLKPLHWDKVRATSDRATVWDQLKSSSFQLNEDIMESLFGTAKKEEARESVVSQRMKEIRVLDAKKSQNIAILLKALNVTQEQVSKALVEGHQDGLSAQVLETLVKMAPTKEEEIKLKDYRGDTSTLGSAERFLKAILDIPFAFKRVEAMLYRANFENEVKYLMSCFQTLEAASQELKSSRLFLKLLEAVLRAGNRMNVGTNRGEASAFKLDTLLKLADIKGTDGQTTLLHFVVQEIIRSEGIDSSSKSESYPTFSEGTFKKQGLQIVSELSRELNHVKKAAGMDSDVLRGYVSKLEMGLQKIRSEVGAQGIEGNFYRPMRVFVKEAEVELGKIKIDERKALAAVKEVTEYFHGDNVKEGVYPLRIFMIVKDFLGILDNVCKEVGQMQDRVMVGSARSFRVPPSASLPVMSTYNVRHNSSSSDEESSYSSPR